MRHAADSSSAAYVIACLLPIEGHDLRLAVVPLLSGAFAPLTMRSRKAAVRGV
jgi:hypothetical protein